MDKGREQVRNSVSREAFDKLDIFARLLRSWNSKINLVAPTTIDELWTRHVLDSIQLHSLVDFSGKWLDLGSGAGFPGLVISCLESIQTVTLVESDFRKSLFLETVVRECSLNAVIINDRIEAIKPQTASVISSRALAPLVELLEYADDHLAVGGVCLFPKGRNRHLELEDARRHWTFDVDEVQSRTSHDSAVLVVRSFTRR